MIKADGNWNDWELKICWNEIDWVNPKGRNLNINPFFTPPFKFYIKDKDTTYHWVGHFKMKLIDVDEFLKIR